MVGRELESNVVRIYEVERLRKIDIGAALAFAGMDNQVGLIVAVLIALTVATFKELRV